MFGAASRTFFSQTAACKCIFGAFVFAAEKTEKEEEKKKMLRRKELPIYVEEKPCTQKEQPEANLLEKTVGCARQELVSLYRETVIIRKHVNDLQLAIQEKGEEMAELILAEGNNTQKVFAITASGVISYYFGFRKVWKTRVLQALVGATAVASLLYPREFKKIVTDKIITHVNDIIDEFHYNEDPVEENSDNLKD